MAPTQKPEEPFSYGNRFFLIAIRDILHDHHLVGILEIFLKFLQCLSLCHDFRVFFQLSEPKLAAFPVDHAHFALHKVPPAPLVLCRSAEMIPLSQPHPLTMLISKVQSSSVERVRSFPPVYKDLPRLPGTRRCRWSISSENRSRIRSHFETARRHRASSVRTG